MNLDSAPGAFIAENAELQIEAERTTPLMKARKHMPMQSAPLTLTKPEQAVLNNWRRTSSLEEVRRQLGWGLISGIRKRS